MTRKIIVLLLFVLVSSACNATPTLSATLVVETQPATSTAFAPVTDTATPSAPTATQTDSVTSTLPATETPLPSETPSPLPSNTPLPTVESLQATITADRLSCRYGPGPEYLYLFAFRAGANIELIGRVDAMNWDWVLVENQVPCWIKAEFAEIQGDIRSLPVVYPGVVKLPITPYYGSSAVLSAQRNTSANEVTISWKEVPVNIGDYEDESMQTYIVELWRCQDGELIFDPIGTRLTFITFVDEPGCSEPSHGRVWVQDKHGYAGPAEIPWPN